MGGLFVVIAYIVAFYYFFVMPTGFRWRALYGDPVYPDGEGFEIQGIDISHYQGKIDWEKLRNAMINKALVRFIIIKSTEGSTLIDENFKDNFYNAREYGFIRGAYHFYSTKSAARQQAYHFLRNVQLEEGDLPPVLDVEHIPEGMQTQEFQKEILRGCTSWKTSITSSPFSIPIINLRRNISPTNALTAIPTGLPTIMWTRWSIRVSGSFGNTPMRDVFPHQGLRGFQSLQRLLL